MRACTLSNYSLVVNADGTPAMLTHPKTGHLSPVRSYDCRVTLDGAECLTPFADEEAGVVLLHDPPYRQEGGVWLKRTEDLGKLESLKAALGVVRIEVRPSACWCDACEMQHARTREAEKAAR